MRVLSCIVATLVLAAGCSDRAPTAQDDDDFGLGGQVSDTTGLIRGVVVDGMVVPVADAKVTLVGAEGNTTSNEEGLFVIDGLEPGFYDVEVGKLGFTTARQQVEVVAGVARPDIAKFQLLQDNASIPFSVPDVWQGFMTCSTSAIQVCAAPNSFLPIFCQAGFTPFCQLPQSVTDDNFLRQVEVLRPPTWVQSELTWRSTQLLGDSLSYIMEAPYREGDLDTTFEEFDRATGLSPVLLTADTPAIEASHLGLDDPVFGGLVPLQLRVFAGPSETAGGAVGVVVQQDWEAFTHVFYGYKPTAGWRFTEDPDVPPPV